jgi:serine/threonine-protein kinase
MATVYLAHDLKHDRPVALKLLRPELAATLGPERFLREIRTTARLQHPHILTVLDSGEAEGLLWYTMPYVEGEGLRERLRREAQLPLDEALRIAREVGLALDYAHRHSVVHRDIKPENILLSDGQALVADFGVAYALEQGTQGRLTEAGLALGTPAYMAPEQATGGPVDARTDVYALGCVLYELLAGEPPYSGSTPQAVIAKRLTDPVPSIRRIREGVPESVEQVLSRALAKAPADRYRSAAELVRALDSTSPSLAAATATPATPSRGPPGPRPRVTRRAAGFGVAGLLGSVAVIATLLARAGEAPKALDENLLVVAPFDVLAPDLSLWREGLVDLLARTLDGAGTLRTVPPSTAVRHWRGPADPDAAGSFARRFGAGLAVFGTVVPAGRDSVRLRAALLDVGRAAVVAEAEVPGRADDMGALSDSLAFRLLRGLGAERPVGVVRSASLGSRSVPALKAFLQGGQLYRAGQWESAIEAFRRAAELDTNFALAYFYQAAVLGWREEASDTLSNTLYLRAGALNRGLAQRDSLLVAAESLSAAAMLERDSPENWRRLRRQRELLEQAARRYPADAEIWFTLADAQYHYGGGPGLELRWADVAAALDRALAADPAFGPIYPHRIELALVLEGPAAARRLIARYLSLRPTGSEMQGMRLLDAMLDPERTTDAEVERMLHRLPAEGLLSAAVPTIWWGDSAEVFVRILRALAKPRPTAHATPSEIADFVSQGLMARGHVREALRMPSVREYSLVFAGQFGIISDDSVQRVMARSTGVPFVYAGWMAARGDTSGLARLVRLADSLARLPGRGPDRSRSATINAQMTRAYLALARRDSAGALAALAEVPDTLYGPAAFRLLHAQLLGAGGRDREAATVVDRTIAAWVYSPSRVLLELERARLAERLGDPTRATEGYQQVVGLWRHADPELQPFVTEARAALERLTAERAR